MVMGFKPAMDRIHTYHWYFYIRIQKLGKMTKKQIIKILGKHIRIIEGWTSIEQFNSIADEILALEKSKSRVCPVCGDELTYYDCEAYCHKCKQPR